jgi:hypothetical protein
MKDQNILFLRDFISYRSFFMSNSSKIALLPNYDIDTIDGFLNKLVENSDYVANIQYVYSLCNYCSDDPRIILSDPIIVNRRINPELLSKFIDEKIEILFQSYYLDDTFLSK